MVRRINILSRHLGYIPLGHSKLDFSFSSPVVGSIMRAVVYFIVNMIIFGAEILHHSMHREEIKRSEMLNSNQNA